MSAERACLLCVVEDDDAVRASAKFLLEAVGYTVRDHASAETLLADAAAMTADVFVTDYQLGGMTGLDLVEQLRERGVRAPAILMTANANHLEERCKRAGVLTVLQKPVPAEELLAWIERARSGR
jgi:FixJ family two-component response regulator